MARGNVAPSALVPQVVDAEAIETDAPLKIDELDGDIIEAQPVSVVDTTAELLGRAKPRRPRARAGSAPDPVAVAPLSRAPRTGGGPRKAVAKKAGPRRSRPTVKKGDADGNR